MSLSNREAHAIASLVLAITEASESDSLFETIVRWTKDTLELAGCAILAPGADGQLRLECKVGQLPAAPIHVQADGRSGSFLPLLAGKRTVAILWMLPPEGGSLAHWRTQFRSALSQHLGLAIERSYARADDTEMLRRADELKSMLLATVSHELRTPLAVIAAAATTLLQKEVARKPSAARILAGAIDREAHHLQQLVQDLLDFSRIEAGALRLNVGWYDLAEVVRESVDRLAPTLGGHTVVIEADEGLPPVSVDYMLIQRVITNLVENALRYAPPAQPVRVTIRSVEGAARVVVSDGGPGIPPEDLERVFEKFRSGDTRGRGVGLGLTICRAMVEAHGGRIWAQSPLVGGRGAAIHFALPFGQPNVNLEIA